LVGFVVERDVSDHVRFSPKQSNLALRLCREYDMPEDMSTAVLVADDGGHMNSDSVLLLFQYLCSPYPLIGALLFFLFPRFLRDFGYKLFARNRGRIWIAFKKATGTGDVQMEVYRDRILGLEDPLDPGWGFAKKES
jgi:predicted DCC family thiol-disulfide oxidoreductase YuxK